MSRIILILLLLSTLLIAGCGCINGFGRDMQSAGRWMQDQ